MTYNYRCTRASCRARVTLKKKKEQYVRGKVCRVCGGNISHDPGPKRRHKREVCLCDGYSFPHRSGTAPWCVDSPREPTEEEYQERFGYYETG